MRGSIVGRKDLACLNYPSKFGTKHASRGKIGMLTDLRGRRHVLHERKL